MGNLGIEEKRTIHTMEGYELNDEIDRVSLKYCPKNVVGSSKSCQISLMVEIFFFALT